MKTLLAIVFILFVAACGGGDDTVYRTTPGPTPTPTPGAPTWNDVKAAVASNCGVCHNGTVHPMKLDSEAAFKQPKVKARIEGGTMPPPPRHLDDGVKAQLLAYLNA